MTRHQSRKALREDISIGSHLILSRGMQPSVPSESAASFPLHPPFRPRRQTSQAHGSIRGRLVVEPESLFALDDAADGWLGKMRRADHYAAVAISIEETAARRPGKNGIGVRTHDP